MVTWRAGFLLSAALAISFAAAADAQPADTVSMRHPPLKYQIVVSATKIPKPTAEVPNGVDVVGGDELRRHGTRTLAQALQDVAGLDTGEGSDNGSRLPNIGIWGLKEFDALLVMVDGVPVGGPFNPSLAQIPVEDIDRIEIVKGPQGTLYGVAAFGGMVQVFTRGSEDGRGHLAVGGGSFDDKHADAAAQTTAAGANLRLAGAIQRGDGWQDRTESEVDRGRLSVGKTMGKLDLAFGLSDLGDTQKWGSPLPFDAGELVSGFEVDRNYAVRGARMDHHVLSFDNRLSWALEEHHRLENTLGVTRDKQISVRSFADPGAASGDTVPSAGVAIYPTETSVYDDLRLISRFSVGGDHQLVTGAALTWGRTTADGIGFDFDQILGDANSIPELGDIPVGDIRSFQDRRTFAGFYAHDEWTPVSRLTLSGGARFDHTDEKLHAQAQEQAPGAPLEVADDSRSEDAWSGDGAALVRLLSNETEMLEAANLYANWRSTFKPAAPNLSEAEGARILDPERTHAVEVGLKLRALKRQAALDLAWFDMTFENLVVSVLGPDTLPELTNAGRERFRGEEVSLTLSPDLTPGATLALGYAHHDARFVEFTFVAPDGQFRNVSGKHLELVPEELFNARLSYEAPVGLGAFFASRYQGRRPFNRRNTFFADPYTEWDAGVWYHWKTFMVSVTGRNLGDDRHVVTESEIGDSQFYVAPPRRVVAELRTNL